jgi:hypothetical protein
MWFYCGIIIDFINFTVLLLHGTRTFVASVASTLFQLG